MLSITADTIVLPLASEADAERTCSALVEHGLADTRVVAVHVVEKAGGAPDKAGVEHREQRAERVFDAARECLSGAALEVDTRLCYGTDVADTVFEAAAAVDADLVTFSPREASRLARFLSGDVALDLITELDRPVVVLPGAAEDT